MFYCWIYLYPMEILFIYSKKWDTLTILAPFFTLVQYRLLILFSFLDGRLFYSTLLSSYFIVHCSGRTAIWIIKNSTFPLTNGNLEFLTTLLNLPLYVWEKKKVSAKPEAKLVLPNLEKERNVCLSITKLLVDIVFCWD